MDFIVGLPPSNGCRAIIVEVDRLSKYAHFGALKSGFDARRVAKLCVETVVKLHGLPKKLLTDRDTIFMSDFWQEISLFVALNFSLQRHITPKLMVNRR